MNNKRIIWLDVCKGVLILLVIFGHSTHGGLFHLNNAITCIAMPGFMACSGWLANKIDSNKIKRRFRQLLVPYFLWSMIAFVVKGGVFSDIMSIILKPDAYYMWFLWALFWIYYIFGICLWLSERLKIRRTIVVIVIMVLLMTVMVILNFRSFGFQFIAYYFIFYSLGYFIHNYENMQIKNNIMICTLLFVWMFLAYYWQLHELPYWIPTNTLIPVSVMQYIYRGITSAIGVLLLFSIYIKFVNKSNGLTKIFVPVGQISLGLYVVHMVMQEAIYEKLSILFGKSNNIVFIFCEFIILFVVSYFIVKLLAKYRYTNQFLLGKL